LVIGSFEDNLSSLQTGDWLLSVKKQFTSTIEVLTSTAPSYPSTSWVVSPAFQGPEGEACFHPDQVGKTKQLRPVGEGDQELEKRLDQEELM
jgi:hypothetical protein